MTHGKYRWDPKSIKAIRSRAGLSQLQLADLLDVATSTVSRWETGRTVPDVIFMGQLHGIAKANGFDAEFFKVDAMVSDASNF